MYVESALFLLRQLLLLSESCRWTGVPGGAPVRRREAKVSLPIAGAPYWGLPLLHWNSRWWKYYLCVFGSLLLRVWRGTVRDSFLSYFHAQVDDPIINVHRPLSCSSAACSSVREKAMLLHSYLCFISVGLIILPYVCQPFQYCVPANINMGCFDRAFSKRCRWIIGAIRMSENWGRLCCISFII